MRRLSLTVLLATGLLSQKTDNPFTGRWDLTITAGNSTYPGWLEVLQRNGSLQARMQPRAGSVRPVAGVKMEASHLILSLSPAGSKGPAMSWDLTVEGDRLSGMQKRGDTDAGQISGMRAPALKRPMPKAWTDSEALFNGKDLTGWEPDNPATNHWVAREGVLLNETKGANLRSTRKFEDFKLHLEYNCPEDGNSGVYLRGRYEIQIEYHPAGREDKLHGLGSIYGYLGPSVDLPRKPGQWESLDVTLVGRYVTILRNGVKTIDNQEIPGITGGALDSHEAEPGPFYFQGDHTGGMRYRNITISLPKR
jgi:hypothetical protein